MEETISAVCSTEPTMAESRIEIPDWLRAMEGILGELNEGVGCTYCSVSRFARGPDSVRRDFSRAGRGSQSLDTSTSQPQG